MRRDVLSGSVGVRVGFIDRSGAIRAKANGGGNLPRPAGKAQRPTDAAVALSTASCECSDDQANRIEDAADDKEQEGNVRRVENDCDAAEKAHGPDNDEKGSHASNAIQTLSRSVRRWIGCNC